MKGEITTKRQLLIKSLTKNGWWLKRRGSSHDIYTNGIDCETIPRHTEINEILAKEIIKRRNLK